MIPSPSVRAFLSTRKESKQPVFAILVDPDKADDQTLRRIVAGVGGSPDLWLCGGSVLSVGNVETTVSLVRQFSDAPICLFPGDPNQITNRADAVLYLSLLSGRNPEYLIGKHIQAAFMLQRSGLEILPTAYLLIDGGVPTSVSYVTQTQPIPAHKPDLAAATALAGHQMGMKHVYLEAGSGARHPVPTEVIDAVRRVFEDVVWVGGGIRTPEAVRAACLAGADVVVVGTAAETQPDTLKNMLQATRTFKYL